MVPNSLIVCFFVGISEPFDLFLSHWQPVVEALHDNGCLEHETLQKSQELLLT